jgi:hypothetical protein
LGGGGGGGGGGDDGGGGGGGEGPPPSLNAVLASVLTAAPWDPPDVAAENEAPLTALQKAAFSICLDPSAMDTLQATIQSHLACLPLGVAVTPADNYAAVRAHMQGKPSELVLSLDLLLHAKALRRASDDSLAAAAAAEAAAGAAAAAAAACTPLLAARADAEAVALGCAADVAARDGADAEAVTEAGAMHTLDLTGTADIVLGAELLWAGCDPAPLVATIARCLRPRTRSGGAGVCHGEGNGCGGGNSAEEGGSSGGGGVCYLVMPRGCRGTEAALLACGRAAGLAWVLEPLPFLGAGKGEEEGAWDDDFYLHTVRFY